MRTLGKAAHVQEYISTVSGHVYAETHADAGYSSSCTAGSTLYADTYVDVCGCYQRSKRNKIVSGGWVLCQKPKINLFLIFNTPTGQDQGVGGRWVRKVLS